MSFDGELDYDPYSGKRKYTPSRPPRRLGPCACGCLLLAILTAAAACLVAGTLLGFSANQLFNNRDDAVSTQLALALTQTALVQPSATPLPANPPTLPPTLTPSATPTATVTPLPTYTRASLPSATPSPSRTPTLTAVPRTIIAPILNPAVNFSKGHVLWSGDIIAVAGGATVKLFDFNALGQEGYELTSGKGDIMDIAFNSDGSLLAAASADGNVLLWQITDSSHANLLAQLSASTNPVWSVTFDPQNRWLAAGTDEGKIRLWQIQDRVEISTQSVQTGPIFALAFDATGERLAIGGSQHVSLYDVRPDGNLQPNRNIAVAGDVTQAAFSPDASYLALAVQDDVELWQLDQRIALHGHTSKINNVVFGNDGVLLVSASDDGTARLWILAGAATTNWHILVHSSPVVSVAINADTTQLITLTADDTLTVWDIATGQPTSRRRL